MIIVLFKLKSFTHISKNYAILADVQVEMMGWPSHLADTNPIESCATFIPLQQLFNGSAWIARSSATLVGCYATYTALHLLHLLYFLCRWTISCQIKVVSNWQEILQVVSIAHWKLDQADLISMRHYTNSHNILLYCLLNAYCKVKNPEKIVNMVPMADWLHLLLLNKSVTTHRGSHSEKCFAREIKFHVGCV